MSFFIDAPDQKYTKLSNFAPNPENPYSPTNNLILATAAKAAYLKDGKCEELLKDWGFQEVQTFTHEKGGDFGYLAKTDEFIVIAFRGTDELKDLLTDLDTKRVRFFKKKKWKINNGLKKAFKRLWNERGMGKSLKSMRDKNQPIWICGHSLGGGIAVATAAYLLLDPSSPIQPKELRGLATFGQLRVVNKKLARALNRTDLFKKRYFRYTNDKDLIPTVPPRTFFGISCYHHWGTPLDFSTDGILQLSKKPERGLRWTLEFTDHLLNNYEKVLLDNIETDLNSQLSSFR